MSVVESDTTVVWAKSLEALAATIQHEHGLVVSSGQKMLMHAVECGNALREVKSQIPRGGFQAWCEENLSFGRTTANGYMRIALHADILAESGVDSVLAAKAFIRTQDLANRSDEVTPDQKSTMIALRDGGMSMREIADALEVNKSTVVRHLADPGRGTRKARNGRRPGRRSHKTKLTITDDLIEGAAIKLRELFGPGTGSVTDSDRDAAVEVLRAAFTYDGPIPGLRPLKENVT